MENAVDLTPAAQRLIATAENVTDADLARPTPCAGRSVGELLGHLTGLAVAFRAAARKELGEATDTNPDANGWPEAPEDWRLLLATRIPALADAWRDPAAWGGMTRAGGVDLPGEIAGLVALDELVLHGWDLARATGQEYDCDEATAAACMAFVGGFDPGGSPGLFGPAVPVDDEAPRFDRLLARSGRDPQWGRRIS